MESIEFEKFGIDKCPDENCNQPYTKDFLKLSVWLHGLILLIQQEVNAGGDELLGHIKNEKILEEKFSGYIGITCPKCLKTKLFKKTAQEVKEFKTFLSSWLKLNRSVEDENGNQSEISSGPFPFNLRYYSPFALKNEALKDFNIESYGFDEPEDDDYFFDDFIVYIVGEEKDFTTPFCSYIIDASTPVGIQTGIYWFKEQDIEKILEIETTKGERIFPRYHYFQELMKKADSLLKYYPHSEKHTQKAKKDYNNLLQQNIENLKNSTGENASVELATFKSFLETRQKEIISNPKMINNFFEVLVLDPCPLKDIAGKPLKGCDYLWAEKAPLFKVDFSFENQLDEYNEIASGFRNIHEKTVDHVQENYTKQYVQEFLRNNLVDFLEEYEGLVHSNEFSYADVWRLKESYLEGLYKETKKGLKNEVPYAMYSEGETWRIIFNSEAKSFKDDLGFLWIYLALLHEDTSVYYTSLNDTYNNRPKGIESDEDIIKYIKLTEELSVDYGGNLTKQFYADSKAISDYTKKLERMILAKDNANAHGETDQAMDINDEINEFIDELKKSKINCSIKDGKVKIKPSKFKDSNYRDINNKIKKNYSDAIKKIKKENPALHAHFAKHIQKKDGAFFYTPSEEIDWHLF